MAKKKKTEDQKPIQPIEAEKEVVYAEEPTEKKKFAEVVREAIQSNNDDGSREKTGVIRQWIFDTYPEHADTAASTQLSAVLSSQRKKLGVTTGRTSSGTGAAPSARNSSEPTLKDLIRAFVPSGRLGRIATSTLISARKPAPGETLAGRASHDRASGGTSSHP